MVAHGGKRIEAIAALKIDFDRQSSPLGQGVVKSCVWCLNTSKILDERRLWAHSFGLRPGER
jgi:hypothetical protein